MISMDMEKMITAYPAMTDIHVTEGEPVSIRVYGGLKKLKEKYTKGSSLFLQDVNAEFKFEKPDFE